MDHRKFIASLSVDQKKILTQKTNSDGIAALVFHFGAIFIFAYLISLKTALTPVLMLFQGIFVIFLFTLLHETVHQSAFASTYINRIAGLISSYLLFLPAQWFKYFHFEHHRHTHIPGKDPELDGPKPQTKTDYLIHVSGIPTWREQIKTIFRNAFSSNQDRFVPTSALVKIRFEARLMLVIYSFLIILSFVFKTGILLYIWIIPIVLGQPFLRLYLMAEHDRCPFVANMFENTRTTFTNALVRKLAWNMPYHVEHHTYPSVPFHKLPKLHQLIQDKLKETEQGYIKFNKKYIAHLQ